MDTDIDRRVVDALVAAGVAHEVLPCDPSLADTAAFCAAYDVDPADSANAILVAGRPPAGAPVPHVVCVVLATHRLDVNGVVRRRLGVRKASFAPADETRRITGMEIGGVTPVGLPEGLAVWVDAAVLDRDRVVIGGGSRSQKIRLAASDLVRLPGVEIVDDLAAPVPAP